MAITWQNVFGPDSSNILKGMRESTADMSKTLSGFADMVGEEGDRRDAGRVNNLLTKLQGFKTVEEVEAYQASPEGAAAAAGIFNPENQAKIRAAIDARPTELMQRATAKFAFGAATDADKIRQQDLIELPTVKRIQEAIAANDATALKALFRDTDVREEAKFRIQQRDSLNALADRSSLEERQYSDELTANQSRLASVAAITAGISQSASQRISAIAAQSQAANAARQELRAEAEGRTRAEQAGALTLATIRAATIKSRADALTGTAAELAKGNVDAENDYSKVIGTVNGMPKYADVPDKADQIFNAAFEKATAEAKVATEKAIAAKGNLPVAPPTPDKQSGSLVTPTVQQEKPKTFTLSVGQRAEYVTFLKNKGWEEYGNSMRKGGMTYSVQEAMTIQKQRDR